MPADTTLDTLRAAVGDLVHAPGDDAYAAATSPDNRSFTQTPHAVITPHTGHDVSLAVTAAAQMGLRVAVQGTGHGTARPVTTREVLIDTSALRSVTVDAPARRAVVGAGARWPDVQHPAHRHGLLGLAGTSATVGVSGYTFAGGVGWLVRQHGLASARLQAVDYVDGTGRHRRAAADATEHFDREALWAYRGGGPVGIATALQIELVPVPELWTGYLLWPADQLPVIASAWADATRGSDTALTSTLAMLRLPTQGPFPDHLRGRPVVHLSYASSDGEAPLRAMRRAVRAAADPAVDTTGPGTVDTLAEIHLDPPVAVAARGSGRWVDDTITAHLATVFAAARIGQPGGLNMIEVRHTSGPAASVDGAMTTVPAPFLLHAVGDGDDDATRARTDHVLAHVEDAARGADVGRAAPAFREGQPTAADALPDQDTHRLRRITRSLDPHGVFGFHRHPAS